MARNWETATLLGAVLGERGDDKVTTRANSGGSRSGVRGLVGAVGEEVERGPVVPQINQFRNLHGADIGSNELHMRGIIAEFGAEPVEGRPGDIDGCDRAVSGCEEFGDQCRCPSADHRDVVRRRRHAAHQFCAGVGLALIPTGVVAIGGGPHRLPVPSVIHRNQSNTAGRRERCNKAKRLRNNFR